VRSPAQILRLFRRADPAHLRAAGDPLPGLGPFTLCRGVAVTRTQTARPRRASPRGLSWTRSIDIARTFAQEHARQLAQWIDFLRVWARDHDGFRFADPGESVPAVFRITVEAANVLACIDRKEEQEFLVLVPATHRLERVTES